MPVRVSAVQITVTAKQERQGQVTGLRLYQAELFQYKILNMKHLYHQVLIGQMGLLTVFILSLTWLY
jgi:hypothetical protein